MSNRHQHLNQALLRIPRRAESADRNTLAATYVAAGSFAALLHSSDHQVLYGRRGTGKTHALLHLAHLLTDTGEIPVYVDLRTIGSAGGLYADSSQSAAVRGTHLLVDALEAVHDELLAVAVEQDVDDAGALLGHLDALAEAATEVKVVGAVERETTVGGSAESGGDVEVSTTPKLTGSHRRSVTAQSRLLHSGVEQHHVLFGPLTRALRGVTRALGGTRLWLLLDEWSSIPRDLQPFLADLLRRSVLPIGGITVKIAAIERRSRFARPAGTGDYLGIEVGSDAASAVNLDELLSLDHGRAKARAFFGQLFYNHVWVRLTSMIKDPPSDPESFVDETFRRGGFAELVRAAEGVPRDAINIAALAAQHAHDEPISVGDVRRAARDWFLRDKQTAIASNEPARTLLRGLVDEVVGHRRSRTFVVDQLATERFGTLEDLHDARLLHLLRRGIADPHHPGTQYDGFAVDYGCYVSLLIDDPKFHARNRGDWLDKPTGVPPESFNLARAAIDLDTLA
ncbi:hypothetical protein [Actinophytocola gossypii]|uniref:AAA+ ATPase domain-containing protein n=1 Tax=Actinophytocola gossypii TaxID=2812003 RepID=A0ABT2JIG8_9PSEU|nr:hypothetical protein [Actinophytocola gossypii]MCT2587677.1 hypothetical protein [Actinophytocola gossypii]